MTTLALDDAAARPNAFLRLYRGETRFNFVGRRWWWYAISTLVIVAGVVSLSSRGFNFGIDFKGGTSWTIVDNGASASTVEAAVKSAGVTPSVVEILGTGKNATVQVQSNLQSLPAAQRNALENKVAAAIAKVTHTEASAAAISEVGPTWGSDITKKAITAVIVFFALVVIYISLRFEWKMAVAALIAVVHDLLVTAGVYSLFHLQVTPDTVIAILTILGYSLYDTVVVFDRITDSSKGLGASGRMTYSDVVNLSMNQVLARSINTSLVAILPVLSVLIIGAEILGATTLEYFGLALVIGLTSGAYSSIFIASPVLAQLKEREKRFIDIRTKLQNRTEREALLTPRAAALLTASSVSAGAGRAPGQARRPAGGGRIQPATARPPAGRPGTAGRIRPAAGRPAPAQARPAPVTTADPDFDGDGNGDAGVDEPRVAPASPRTGGGQARRPPARRPPPRKKGKGKGGKRR